MFFVTQGTHGRKNSRVVTFGRTRCKNNLIVIGGVNKVSHRVAGLVNDVAVFAAEGMHAGRITVFFGKVR